MDMRELKALELAARAKIVAADDGTWTVPGQTPGASYRVVTWPGAESCTCEDYQLRRQPCKHVIAARLLGAEAAFREASGLWLPLVLLAGVVLWMYHILADRPGGQPIGALEWFFAAVGKRVRGMMPARRDEPAAEAAA